MKYFKNSGLVIIKHFLKDKEIYWCWNISPMGLAPLNAHGHLDALSFYLSVNGKELFVDPGTYLYHSGGKWRRYLRSNSAHNTLKVNGYDFSGQPGDFMYGEDYITELLEMEDNDRNVRLKMQIRFDKIAVTREFEYLFGTKTFTIIDSISLKNVTIEQFFHLHPECRLERENRHILIENGNVKLDLYLDEKAKIDVFYGETEPFLGWYSPNFNVIMKSATIRTLVDCRERVSLVTRGRII